MPHIDDSLVLVIEFTVGLYSLFSWSVTLIMNNVEIYEWETVAIRLRVVAAGHSFSAVSRERALVVMLFEPVMCCQLGHIVVR